jgi:DNA-binding MarR family transcriptional regulator
MGYRRRMDPSTAAGPHRTAFLLSQLGALASARFAERTRTLGLTPADAGVLRLLGRTPGLNQRVLADRLGALPSRIVALIDSLEARGLVERTRSSADRRSYELRLTGNGQELLAALRRTVREHEDQLLGSLTPEQAEQLHDLLARLAAANSLDPDLHQNTGS